MLALRQPSINRAIDSLLSILDELDQVVNLTQDKIGATSEKIEKFSKEKQSLEYDAERARRIRNRLAQILD